MKMMSFRPYIGLYRKYAMIDCHRMRMMKEKSNENKTNIVDEFEPYALLACRVKDSIFS